MVPRSRGTGPLDPNDPLMGSGSDALVFRPDFVDGVAAFDVDLVTQPLIELVLPDGSTILLNTADLQGMGMIQFILVPGVPMPDGVVFPGLTPLSWIILDDLDDGMSVVLSHGDLQVAQAENPGIDLNAAGVIAGVQIKGFFALATTREAQVVGLFLPASAAEWRVVPLSLASDGGFTVDLDEDGIFVLAEIPPVQQILKGGFNPFVHLGSDSISAEDFAASFDGRLIGVWRFNPGAQRFDSFPPDAPSFANSLDLIDPRDALLVLLSSAVDPADAEFSIETLASLPVDRTIDLVNGWNQFAFTGAPEPAMSELFAGIALQFGLEVRSGFVHVASILPGSARVLVPVHDAERQ